MSSRTDPIRIAELPSLVGSTVTLSGWVTHLRSSGKIAFIVMRDGTGLLQCVVPKKEVSEAAWDAFGKLTLETSITVTGAVRTDARQVGGVELGLTDLAIFGPSALDYPIQPKEHGVDFLLDNRHFWLRTPRQVAIARIRNEIEQAIHDFYYERGFLRVDTPILTAAIGERSDSSRPSTSRRGTPTSRRPGNSTARPRPRHSGRSTPSARPSAPRNRRPVGTSPNSG